MGIAQSRITAQGQVSIPVAVMRLLGLAPGEVIDWEEMEGRLVVQKAGRYSIEDARKALRIPQGVHKTDLEIKDGIKARMKAKHAVR
jgi:bifunctional DNA-binding transcriptional regulator/antitoxin component of YhaV-PrlF toxin-antitoxin module